MDALAKKVTRSDVWDRVIDKNLRLSVGKRNTSCMGEMHGVHRIIYGKSEADCISNVVAFLNKQNEEVKEIKPKIVSTTAEEDTAKFSLTSNC